MLSGLLHRQRAKGYCLWQLAKRLQIHTPLDANPDNALEIKSLLSIPQSSSLHPH